MKRNFASAFAVLALGVSLPSTLRAAEVSVDFFYDNLDPYGDWVDVGDYGYCWHPRDVDRNWRPYSDGHWVHTDAGWTWVSEEPYGWAVYHYGRWARAESVGWVWVPGTEWGPAWVSWRHNDRYLGWAPLPPEARFTASLGFGPSVDVSFDIGPSYYSFVEVRDIGAPRLRDVIIEPQRNITIINQTTNITKIRTVNNVVINEGPRFDVVSRASARPIQQLKLERTTEVKGDALGLAAKVDGGTLRVAAPAVAAAKTEAKPKKVVAKIDKAELNHGWKDAGSPDEVDKLRAKMKSEPATASSTPGNEPGAGQVNPTSDESNPSAKKGVAAGQPQPGETVPPEKGKRGKGDVVPPGKKGVAGERPQPGENPPTAIGEKRKPGKGESIAPGEPNPSAPDAKEKPAPAPVEPREKKEKHSNAGELPPPPEPREPKAKPEPVLPSRGPEPDRPQRTNPKPEIPHAAPHPPVPAEPGGAKPGGKEKDKKGKDQPE